MHRFCLRLIRLEAKESSMKVNKVAAVLAGDRNYWYAIMIEEVSINSQVAWPQQKQRI